MTPIMRNRFRQRSLPELVAEGENRYTEFKRLVHSPAKIAKPIAAFANTEGGVILVGVDDDKRIVGIESEKEMLEIVHDAVTFHIDPEPEIETYVEEFKRRLVLMVFVPESPDKPHYHIETVPDARSGKEETEKQVYIREGDCNKAVRKESIALMRGQGKHR